MTWFGGVSRFQFSYTDCPECNGVGFLEQPSDDSLRPQDITEKTTLSTEQADLFLQKLAEILSQAMLHGEKVQLRGFGSFSRSSSVNTGTKEIRFSSAKRLRHELNND